MMSMKPSTKTVKFVVPESGVQTDWAGLIRPYIENVLNLLLYSHTYLRKTKRMILMSTMCSTYIVKFMVPETARGSGSRSISPHIKNILNL